MEKFREYEENYNNQSYIKLVAGEDRWIKTFASKFYKKVAHEYCIQLRDEEETGQNLRLVLT